jgi:hypothetical protein
MAMKRLAAAVAAALAAALVCTSGAAAASPTIGEVSATDLQGVSAYLVGAVNPQGLPTTYRFEYVPQAGFNASGFTTAIATTTTAAGSGVGEHPASASISSLLPDTVYRYRLVATSTAGTTTGEPAKFTTTHGFGFLPGVKGFAVSTVENVKKPISEAGSHPEKLSIEIGFNLGGEFEGQPGVPLPDGDIRDLSLEMPAGLVVEPLEADGEVAVETSLGGGETQHHRLFRLPPPPGVAARLGFQMCTIALPISSECPASAIALMAFNEELRLNEDGSYTTTLSAHNIPQSVALRGLEFTLDPTSVTLPLRCSGTLSFTATADAWQQPDTVSADELSRNAKDLPVEMTACPEVPFNPFASALLTEAKASWPSGYSFSLSTHERVPTKAAVLTLSQGLTINSAMGAGLGVCTATQFAAETATSKQGDACPNAAKIGDFTVSSQLFEKPFVGAVYLGSLESPKSDAADEASPSLELPLYLVARIPARGVLIKATAGLVVDSGTGQVSATLDDLPQLPYEWLTVAFRTGQRAPLSTPPSCGFAKTTIELTPWVGNLHIERTSESLIKENCPTGAGSPFAPGVIAGGVNSNVNSYTPYLIHISRQDSEQEITSYSLVLPKGITAKLAGIPFCPDAAIAAARRRSGFAEASDPSCPESSRIGHVLSGYGLGHSLAYSTGGIYLAGPYRGAPLSAVTINPATVGPFDLGTIVIRSAFQVDPLTAQLRLDSSASDPIPHTLRGVPLQLRDIRIYMDRPEFTHSPSSCAPSELTSTLTGAGASFENPADDSTTTATSYFQLLNCLTLHFQPQLGLRLRGGTKRRAFPQLRAAFVARGPEDSNLKEISVTIPHQEFLAQEHIEGICSKAQFNADSCPADSVYGSAVAYTPLLDEPLRGNVYLRSNPEHAIPDLVASLYSGAVKIVLEGRIGPGKKGGIEAFFANLPDQPLSRFVMTLYGGKRGLLQNSADICAVPPVASVKALAQNNIGAVFTTKLRGKCRRR